MKNDLAFKVSGIIFLLVAMAHFSRAIYQFPVIIGNFTVPVMFSMFMGTIALLLAIWVFKSIKEKG